MRIFRFARAELKKIYSMPGTIAVVFFCLLAVIVSGIFFSPIAKNAYETTLLGESVTVIHSKFTNGNGSDSKTGLHQELLAAKILIENFIGNDIYTGIKADVAALETFLNNDFYNALLNIERHNSANPEPNSYYFSTLKTMAADLSSKFSALKDRTDFYITTTDKDSIENFLFSLQSNIPGENSIGNFKVEDYIDRGNFIVLNFINPWYKKVTKVLENTKAIEISEKDLADWNKFYESTEVKLTMLADEANAYVSDLTSESDTKSESIEEYRKIISRYKSTSELAIGYFQSKLKLIMAGEKSDSEIQSLTGFSEFNRYELTEISTKADYFINSKSTFYDEYLTSLSFGNASDFGGNGYDFTFYSMQIIFIITAILCVCLASASFAGERANGTLRMVLVRPYKRKKIYLGKLLAILMAGGILMFVFMLLSLLVGGILFGLPISSTLTVVNATSVAIIPTPILLLIAFAFQVITLMFFLSVAGLISVIFRSGIFSAIVSLIFLILTYLFNYLFLSTSWHLFLPFPHIDLFKFFGGASSQAGFLGASLYMNTNIVLSIFYLTTFIFAINIAAIFTLKKKSL